VGLANRRGFRSAVGVRLHWCCRGYRSERQVAILRPSGDVGFTCRRGVGAGGDGTAFQWLWSWSGCWSQVRHQALPASTVTSLVPSVARSR